MEHVQSRATSRGTLWLLLAGTMWGTVGAATQAISTSNSTNPLSLTFLRLVIASPLLLLAGWRLLGRHMWSVSRRDFVLMVLMGALVALYQSCYFAAISYTGVTLATLVAVCGTPVLVTLSKAAWERRWLPRSTLLCVILAVVGTALLISGGGSASARPVSLLGIAFALGSASGYVGVIFMGRLLTDRHHPLQVTAISFTCAAAFLCVLTLANGFATAYSTQGWALILYVGVIPTALAYGLFLVGVRTTPAAVVSVMVLLEPLTAALLAWLLFGESLSLFGVVGAATLLIAIYLLSNTKG